jgi:hypothetical protein
LDALWVRPARRAEHREPSAAALRDEAAPSGARPGAERRRAGLAAIQRGASDREPGAPAAAAPSEGRRPVRQARVSARAGTVPASVLVRVSRLGTAWSAPAPASESPFAASSARAESAFAASSARAESPFAASSARAESAFAASSARAESAFAASSVELPLPAPKQARIRRADARNSSTSERLVGWPFRRTDSEPAASRLVLGGLIRSRDHPRLRTLSEHSRPNGEFVRGVSPRRRRAAGTPETPSTRIRFE